MRSNPVREKLARDEPVFGPMIMEFTSPGVAQIFAGAGADFIVYDQEAGCLDTATIKTQMALTRGLGIAPLVIGRDADDIEHAERRGSAAAPPPSQC